MAIFDNLTSVRETEVQRVVLADTVWLGLIVLEALDVALLPFDVATGERETELQRLTLGDEE